MLIPLLLGILIIVGNMVIQVLAVVVLVRMLMSSARTMANNSFLADTRVISVVLLVLLAGHVLQFATWALVFIQLGEFNEFSTAFYFSTVNFTSLGYGDIVMSDRWRLLGGLEAANGVLMFGLSAGTLLSVMNRLFTRHVPTGQKNPPDTV